MSEHLPILHIRADQFQLMLAVVAAATKYREARSHASDAASNPPRALAWRELCRTLDAYEASIEGDAP